MTALPKPRPRALEKADAKRALALIDKAERLTCKQRSGGRCEVQIVDSVRAAGRKDGKEFYRCTRFASENHHLLAGSGRRNSGKSILSRHRLYCCSICHKDITNHVLRPIGLQAEREWAETVRYERRR